ncbi:MAG: Flavin containing amine oxidoreductase, partial [uncultured Gemmatimonadetes bacterium]
RGRGALRGLRAQDGPRRRRRLRGRRGRAGPPPARPGRRGRHPPYRARSPGDRRRGDGGAVRGVAAEEARLFRFRAAGVGGPRRGQLALGPVRRVRPSLGGALRSRAGRQRRTRPRIVPGPGRAAGWRLGRGDAGVRPARAHPPLGAVARGDGGRAGGKGGGPERDAPLRRGDGADARDRRLHHSVGAGRPAVGAGRRVDGGVAGAARLPVARAALVRGLRLPRRLRRAGGRHLGVGGRALLRLAPGRRAGDAHLARGERVDRAAPAGARGRPRANGRAGAPRGGARLGGARAGGRGRIRGRRGGLGRALVPGAARGRRRAAGPISLLALADRQPGAGPLAGGERLRAGVGQRDPRLALAGLRDRHAPDARHPPRPDRVDVLLGPGAPSPRRGPSPPAPTPVARVEGADPGGPGARAPRHPGLRVAHRHHEDGPRHAPPRPRLPRRSRAARPGGFAGPGLLRALGRERTGALRRGPVPRHHRGRPRAFAHRQKL